MQSELNFIEWIQQIRSPLLDIFFKGLNFLDTKEFFFVLIPALWFGKNWKVGMRLFTIVLFSSALTSNLKVFFAFPRPYHLLPKLALVTVPGFGFPSGGATTAALLSSLLLFYGNGKWKWPVAFMFFFFVSLSRLYLGVHFLRDVLAGWLLGFSICALFILVWPSLENALKKCSRPILFSISQGLPFLLLLLIPSLFSLCIIAMGLSLGLFINDHYKLILPEAKKTKDRILGGTLGVLTSISVYSAVKFLPSYSLKAYLAAQLLFVGLAISTFGTWLCLKLLHKNKKRA